MKIHRNRKNYDPLSSLITYQRCLVKLTASNLTHGGSTWKHDTTNTDEELKEADHTVHWANWCRKNCKLN